MKILHIAAHLGGGAGKAVSGIAIQGRRDFSDEHRIVLLQQPEKFGHVQACRENSIPVEVWNGNLSTLDWADVIAVSWWNHPIMAHFLREFPPLSTPMVLWSHVNGCHYPFLPFRFADAFDIDLFTTPYTLDNPIWTPYERQHIHSKAEIIYGIGAFDAARIVPKNTYASNENFVIGYAGTLNYGKLHPDFVLFCQEAAARIPNARFVMAGDRNDSLERDIRASGLWDRFSFPGFVFDVPNLMRTFDVFGYLLNPSHYGTTENVLLEAMACGLPCIVLRQNVERFIVPSETEFTVENPTQYGERLSFLKCRPGERERMGREARGHVQKIYNAQENVSRFRAACIQAAQRAWKPHDFSFLGDTPWQWFLYCLDESSRKGFQHAAAGSTASAQTLLKTCPPILREKRKSSLRHFAAVYPEDESLRLFDQWMEEIEHG